MRSNALPPGWELLALSDAGVSVLDCEHKTPPEAGHGHPYIAIPNLVDGKLDLSRVRRITADHLREWTRRTKPRAGDVIVTRRARVGDSAVVPSGLDCAIGQNLVILRSTADRVDQRFLRWATRGPLWAGEVNRLRNVGAVFDSLNVRDIARLRIPVPPIAEQQRIAAVLRALDDKIDSNRRLATVLESTVATMFRHEFVDLRHGASAQGRLGNRQMGTLSALADIAKDPVQPSATPEGTFEHFSIPAFDAGGDPEEAPGATILSGKIRIPDRDVVLLSKLNPRRKRVWWPRPSGVGTPVCSPEFLVLVPRARIPASYVYAVVGFDERFYDELLGHVTGTTGSRQRVRPRDALSCAVLVPSADELQAWDAFARPLLDLAHGTCAENRTLARVREALLPRLVSGAIRVPETGHVQDSTGTAAEEIAA